MKVKILSFFMVVVSCLLLPTQVIQATAFMGTGTGDIPDSLGGPGDYSGGALIISFHVSGLTNDIESMSLSMNIRHQWVGDLDTFLTSPEATQFTVFSRVGPGLYGYGCSADLDGIYVFGDFATNTLRDITEAMNLSLATPIDYTNVISAGFYRTSTMGPDTESATSFSTNSNFVGLSPAQANGTWTLTVRDGGNGDTGTVYSATLYINPPELKFAAIAATNGMIHLDLTGPISQNFTLWRSTNVALPFASWKSFGNGAFDVIGNATFLSAITATNYFYRITVP